MYTMRLRFGKVVDTIFRARRRLVIIIISSSLEPDIVHIYILYVCVSERRNASPGAFAIGMAPRGLQVHAGETPYNIITIITRDSFTGRIYNNIIIIYIPFTCQNQCSAPGTGWSARARDRIRRFRKTLFWLWLSRNACARNRRNHGEV